MSWASCSKPVLLLIGDERAPTQQPCPSHPPSPSKHGRRGDRNSYYNPTFPMGKTRTSPKITKYKSNKWKLTWNPQNSPFWRGLFWWSLLQCEFAGVPAGNPIRPSSRTGVVNRAACFSFCTAARGTGFGGKSHRGFCSLTAIGLDL